MKARFSVDQTVQKLGDGLAVRITAPVAKAAGLTRGTSIKVEVVDGGVFLRIVGKPKLTLAQMLEAFDLVIPLLQFFLAQTQQRAAREVVQLATALAGHHEEVPVRADPDDPSTSSKRSCPNRRL